MEKRFTIFGEWHKDNVIDEIRDNTGEYVTIGRVVDLLNENEQLKEEIENIKDVNVRCCNDYSYYRRENEQLKHDASVLVQSNKDYRIENEQLKDSLLSTSKELQYGVKKVQKLAKENEQLKKENKELRQYLGWQDMELEEIEDAKRCDVE